MRIWSIHPRYLDRQGLIAAWSEGLLAQKVLAGETRGWTKHPQLDRFRCPDGMGLIGRYLSAVCFEGQDRGYDLRLGKIREINFLDSARIPVTAGQLAYEATLINARAPERKYPDPAWLPAPEEPEPNPCLVTVAGSIEPWEKV